MSEMEKFLEISSALSDANRVRALLALQKGELCACQMLELLGLAPSTVSKHMSILRHAGLVESRKDARWVFYRLPATASLDPMVKGALDWVFLSLNKDNIALFDSKRLSDITKQDLVALCKTQRKR